MSDFMTWVTHGMKRGKFEMGQREVRYVVATGVALALVAALYLVLVSRTAAQGRHVQQLRAELLWLERENEQLEVAVARAGSVLGLSARAEDLEFVPAEQVEFLRVVRVSRD